MEKIATGKINELRYYMSYNKKIAVIYYIYATHKTSFL